MAVSTYPRIPPAVLALIAVLAAPAAGAGAIQSHAELRSAVQSFLESHPEVGGQERWEVEVGELDPRLRLVPCDASLEAFAPPGSRLRGSTTVGIRCTGTATWTVYVPAKIAVYGDVVVTRHALPRGARLSSDDLTRVERELTTLPHGHLSDPERGVGLLLKRPLAGGAVLTPQVLESPRLVRRGERVTLVGAADGFEVRMAGEALGDGVEGERVRVRALSSRRVVEGTVISLGVIKVTL